jgi:hypothetical protein
VTERRDLESQSTAAELLAFDRGCHASRPPRPALAGPRCGHRPGLRRENPVCSSLDERRVKSNYGKIDDNDDELIKSLADHAFAEERFSWDNLPG